jgi:hydrogenase maturation protease
MEPRIEALVLGIGNVLWADEGFGVRCVEALHAAFAFPAGVVLMDGGTLGLNLYEPVTTADRVLVFDAIDFALAPGTLRVLRGDEVPAWGRTKLSPHQTGFNDVLALAGLNGRAPAAIAAIGVQPAVLSDFGGSLTEGVRARIPEAVALAERELAGWGFPGRPREPGESFAALNATPLEMSAYEAGRPSEADACRSGDPRLLAHAATGHERSTSSAVDPSHGAYPSASTPESR